MCLVATAEARNLFQPVPMRKTAWKVVQISGTRRAPPYRDDGSIDYAKGSVHSAPLDGIFAGRKVDRDNVCVIYEAGLHVFTRRAAAVKLMDSWNTAYEPHRVVRVAVDPADWIADGDGHEAVYARLKVLT
jgi:hypothetical protein